MMMGAALRLPCMLDGPAGGAARLQQLMMPAAGLLMRDGSTSWHMAHGFMGDGV
eukprot:SAG31_NODE_3371_length_4353_cov_3.023507_8_plen_54_part_00